MKALCVLAALVVVLAQPMSLTAGEKPFGYGPLPSGAWACLGSPRFVSDNPAHTLAFSPDGKLLATGTHEFGAGGTDIHLWDLTSGQELFRFKGHHRMVIGLRFTADSKTLISAAWDGDHAIRLWEVATGKEQRRFTGHTAVITGLELTPDGKHLVTSSQDGTTRVWDFASGKELRSIKYGATSIALLADGKTLVTNGGELWDIHTGAKIRDADGARRGLLSPDGKKLVVLGYRHAAVWDVASGKELYRLEGLKRKIYSVAFSPDSKMLATGGGGYKNPGAGFDDFLVELRLWDADTGKELQSLKGHNNTVECVAFSSDGKTLASAGRDFRTLLWDVKTGRQFSRFAGHSDEVTALAFTRDSATLISSSYDGSVRIWDALQRKEQAVLSGHAKAVMCLSLTPDGKTLATGSNDGTVRLWDLSARKELRTLATGHGEVWAVAFSPDGKTLGTGSRGQAGSGGTVRLWDWQAARERLRLAKQEGAHCLGFAPDGKTFAVGHHDRISTWNVDTGASIYQFHAHCEWVNKLDFLPDGTLLSAGGGDLVMERAARHWDLKTKERQHQFSLDKGYRTTMAVSPDGRLLAWACENRLQIWEIATKYKVGEYIGQRKHISALAFAPDGLTLASGGADGAILLWDLTGLRKDGKLTAAPLSDADLDANWRALGKETGRAALWRFALRPREAVPFLRRQLFAKEKLDPQRLRELLKGLDAANFVAREKATRELEQLGEQAAAALERALKNEPSLEFARRARALLDRLERERAKERDGLATTTVQMLRALEALERCATPEAQALLQEVAQYGPSPRATREAEAALNRLTRAAPPPGP